MKPTVYIPNANRDERIGSVFNHLFAVINSNELACCEDVIWDFTECKFYHPFFLFPLAIYKSNCGKRVECVNKSAVMRSYLDCVMFDEMLHINDNDSLRLTIEGYLNKSYIPICRFDRRNDNIDSMQTVIQNAIERQRNIDRRFKEPLSYLISELVCNIQQHSESEYGYIYTQYLQRDNSLNICIADNGITIFGSYVKNGRYIELIGDSEANAIRLANEGYSTKNLPDAENRGYGISSSKKMIVDGLGGDFFMLSGGAFHRHDLYGSSYIDLPDSISWDGTIILIRIPLSIRENFNYLKYIQ